MTQSKTDPITGITAHDMCKEMVANDLAVERQYALLKTHDYDTAVATER